LQEYLDEPVVPRSVNTYEWWSVNRHRYKDVARLAQIYLSVPATSVASERLFSAAGNVIGNRRSCIDPNQVEKLVFLHENL